MFDATDETQARRCQGCGNEVGAWVSFWTGTKYRKEHITALVATQLLDYGPRRLCGRCRGLARKRNRRAGEAHLTLFKALTDGQGPTGGGR